MQGGKKGDLTEILKDRVSKILDTIKHKTQGQLWVEVALGFDGAGSYKEFGRKNDPDQKTQIFGEIFKPCSNLKSLYSVANLTFHLL